ncbi:tumor necrosis factor receptor superfamily member 3 isoform X3 [Xenopus tropicalis]|uniref:Tumor necrosis factor receptor superfamily member 3 isoform X3 n=1 Tax=Xenopus tropicalis TaxID=8364 RepID=A0A8J1JXT3_XENTR|nr:tumor necrosis factor receptor superfamily member 3 isoform X3 [Xenopus tropicalis]
MKVGPVPWLFLLLLGSLWRDAQQAPKNEKDCGEHEYFNFKHKKCCSKCPPGTYASSQCNAKSNTTCTPCRSDFYTEQWNYADRCRMCFPCPKEDTRLVATVNCSATTATVCECQYGFVCEVNNALGKCMNCKRVATPPPTMEPSTDQGAPLSIIIPVAIGLILFACIILLLFPNTRVLKRIVRAMGTKKDNKSSSLVDAKTEQGVTQDQEKLLPSPSSYATIVERNKGQPYGNNCPTQDATGPIQVQDDNLPFPIKETQTPETEEP